MTYVNAHHKPRLFRHAPRLSVTEYGLCRSWLVVRLTVEDTILVYSFPADAEGAQPWRVMAKMQRERAGNDNP